ncbi:MAG: DNA primase, partial [Clostridia bacterium]|nr:DNA primase [Clostridia bacterium]
FLWAFAGLQRLAANNFCFTESDRAKGNRKAVKQDANNLIAFLESKDYIRFDPEVSVSSEELYKIYCVWCKENGLTPLKQRSVSDYLIDNQAKYNIEYSNNHLNYAHRRVRGFRGIEALIHPSGDELKGFTQVWPKDNPFEEKTHQESFSM